MHAGPQFINCVHVHRAENRKVTSGVFHKFPVIVLEPVQRPLAAPFDFAREDLFPLTFRIGVNQFSRIALKPGAERTEVGPRELGRRGEGRKFAVKVYSDAFGQQVEHIRCLGFEHDPTPQHAITRSRPGKRLIDADVHTFHDVGKDPGHDPIQFSFRVKLGVLRQKDDLVADFRAPRRTLSRPGVPTQQLIKMGKIFIMFVHSNIPVISSTTVSTAS